MCFSTRCLTTGSTGVSVTRRTKFLKSFFLSRVSMGKVLEKITILSKKFDIYMVSRFDWSILILFFSLVGTYASIGVKVSHRVEIMYFFIFLIFARSGPGWGYDWWTHINMDATLPFESSCARDGGMWWIQRRGDHIWSWWCGEFFYHESYCDERVVMTIYGFQICLWRQFRWVGLCPYMAYGRGLPIYGNAATPQVYRETKMSSSLLLPGFISIPDIISKIHITMHKKT